MLLRHLALQLRMGSSRHSARATLLWLCSSLFCAILGGYAWWTDHEISLLGFILSLLFAAYFLFGSGSFGHQAKWAVDERLVKLTGDQQAIRALIERLVRESPSFMAVDIPALTAPSGLPSPRMPGRSWDSLTKQGINRLRS